MDMITHIISSPLARTLETAQLSFPQLFACGLQIEPWIELKEVCGGHKGSRCSPKAARQEQFGSLPVLWEMLDDNCYLAVYTSEDGRFKFGKT